MKNWKPRVLFLRPECLALVAILLLAFALRAFRLAAQPIWWDESLSVYRAQRDLATVLSNVILIQGTVTHDTLPPLYFVFLHLVVPLFGTGEFALRFMSLAVNVATVPLVYVLARRWFAWGSPAVQSVQAAATGVLAALLAALSPFYIWYAQEARPYALVLFWSTLAIYALTRAMDCRPPAAAPDKRWLAVYLLAATAALYTHYYALFLLPVHALMIVILTWPRPRLWFALPALPAVATLPLIPATLASMSENAHTGPYFVPLDVIARDIINSFSVGVTANLDQVLWIDAGMLALYLAGVIWATTGARRSRLTVTSLLLAYMLVPIGCVFTASFVRPLYQNSRYLISISPGFYLGVAAGVIALARRWRLLAIPAVALVVAGAALSLNHLYFDPSFGKDDHRAWAQALRERARAGDLLILDSPHTEALYRYYAPAGIPWISLPILRADRQAAPAADLDAVRAAYRAHRRVWFLTMDVAFDDPDRRIEALLNREGVLLDRTLYPATSTELALALYVPAFPTAQASEIAHPLDVSFIGNLRLRGYAAPATAAAGETVTARLYWQIDEPVGEDYAVSLRLVDEAGNRIAQLDSVPLGNQAGSSHWPPRTIVVDEHELPIPAGASPGIYRLQVVPYHAATGSALGDVVALSEILLSSAEVR